MRARTRTVCLWTGLSKQKIHSVSRTVRSQDSAGLARPHGPPPTALRHFRESRRLRREAAAVAGLCSLFGVTPASPAGAGEGWFPGVLRGERLCLAYETYLTFVPEPRLTLEHAVLLATALATGGEVGLERCPDCGCATLVDCLAPGRPCTYCTP